jgi:hypothetical protein
MNQSDIGIKDVVAGATAFAADPDVAALRLFEAVLDKAKWFHAPLLRALPERAASIRRVLDRLRRSNDALKQGKFEVRNIRNELASVRMIIAGETAISGVDASQYSERLVGIGERLAAVEAMFDSGYSQPSSRDGE